MTTHCWLSIALSFLSRLHGFLLLVVLLLVGLHGRYHFSIGGLWLPIAFLIEILRSRI